MPHAHRLHARCLCSAAGAPFVLAGTERQYERARPFAIRHLALDLALDFESKSVSGTATLSFERIAPAEEQLVLDAVGFELGHVRIDFGAGLSDAPHEYDGDQIRISIPDRVKSGRIVIDYAATPARGLYFLAPDDDVPDRPEQVWSQCQDEDARHWFPCHDKPHVKMTTELRVKVPTGFTVLSNGDLVMEDTPSGDDPWLYHFKLDQPHPSYLVTLVAGRFDVIDDRPAHAEEREIPVRYLVPPGKKADGKRSFGETPRMIELFGRLTGVPFPWSRYSQVVVSDFIFGGMENTTATTMYEHILLDERAAIDVSSHDLVAHELAHQWFGDYVTCRDWSHGWLNEGFATFFEHLEREDRLGRDEYDYGIEADLGAYLSEAGGRYQRAIVCRDYQAPIDLFDRHLYEKGGLVLHMLRRKLGDELFWTGIRRYLEKNAHGIVETNDLQRALETVSGQSLEQFFDQWVYRPGHPALKIKVSYEDGQLSVNVKQTQKTGDTATFAFPLEIMVADAVGRVRRYEKQVTTTTDTLVVPHAERPAWVTVDPDFRVTADVTLEAPADLLRAQLASATTARGRWSAARALGKRHDPPTIKALAATLSNQDEAWMVRAEAAKALGRIRGEANLAALLDAVDTDHAKVRRAIAAALGNFRKPKAAKALAKLAKKDLSYLVESEAARALGRTRQKNAAKTLVPMLERGSWADIARAGALDGLAALRDEDLLDDVRRYTRYGVPTRGRRAAIAAMAKLSDSRKTREHLQDLLEDEDPHLRIDVVGALESLGDPKARGALNVQLSRELDGRVARRIREALRRMGDSGAAERKRVADEMESLKGELEELKTRLARMEAAKNGNGKEKPDGGSTPPPPAAPKKKAPAAEEAPAKKRAPAKKKTPAKKAPAPAKKRAPAKKKAVPAKVTPAKKTRRRKR